MIEQILFFALGLVSGLAWEILKKKFGDERK